MRGILPTLRFYRIAVPMFVGPSQLNSYRHVVLMADDVLQKITFHMLVLMMIMTKTCSRTTYLQEAATEAQSILNTGVNHHSILRRRFSSRRSEFTSVNPLTNSVFALLRSLLQQSLQEAGRSDHSFNMSVAIWGCFVRALQRRTAFQALQRRL